MILKIDDNLAVSELQDKFNECFPYLKIEFYKDRQAMKDEEPLNGMIRIGNITRKHNTGELTLKSWYRAGKVCQDLKNDFGLLVKLFQHQNNEWIEMKEDDLLKAPDVLSIKNNIDTSNSSTGADEEIRLSI